jgi:hypothetical protein
LPPANAELLREDTSGVDVTADSAIDEDENSLIVPRHFGTTCARSKLANMWLPKARLPIALSTFVLASYLPQHASSKTGWQHGLK